MKIRRNDIVPDTPQNRRLLIAVATYNEIDNLPRLVEQIQQYVPHADLLVVDDNSPDGTGQWCQSKAEVDQRVHCIHRSGKLGLGTATIAVLKYAADHDYPFVVNLDADLSHPPSVIPDLVAGMQPAVGQLPVDVMIGSRYVQGGAIEGWPWWRLWMSRAVNAYARRMLALSPRDCSGSFRCYRTDRLKELEFESFRSHGYAFLEEILWRLKRIGCRFDELPIVFINRQHGRSKINLREAIHALWIIFRLGMQNRMTCKWTCKSTDDSP